MISKRCSSVLVVMALTLLFTLTAHSAREKEIKSLEGITGMVVLVEPLDDDAKRKLPFSFDESQVRVDTEFKLRMAGIKVFPSEELITLQVPSCLCVNVTIDVVGDFQIYYYSISIALKQMVSLERKPNFNLFATTWQAAGIGYRGKHKTFEEIRNRIKDQVDIFINDYLSVNPKGGK